MEKRSTNGYNTFLIDFTKTIEVICPYCRHHAVVNTSGESPKHCKVTCGRCGYNKSIQTNTFVLGQPVDPYFRLQLWLSISLGSNHLWAYNHEHLSFIRQYVEAKHRERTGPEIFNSSLGSRLPKWMLASKNRNDILQAINRLEKMDDGGRAKNML